MAGDSTISAFSWPWPRGSRGAPRAPALAIAWSYVEPERAGEVALVAARDEQVLGRGGVRSDDPCPRLLFARQRPGRVEDGRGVRGPAISRDQLRVRRVGGDQLEVRRTGRCRLRVNGQTTDVATVRPGDTVTLELQLVLLVVERPTELPPLRAWPETALQPFGAPDDHGLVGEAPVAWALRDELAFVAAADAHALLVGPSGVGKELVARAIHALSPRRDRRLVARNAATLPPGLIDAELFGNVRGYPNPGMQARPGLIGEADGGTLFLDEIGELPLELQAHLLRVLDAGGDYQRLGEGRPRRADLRLVAATNRDASALKHDFAARLPARLRVPGLGERREDIPLILRHLARRWARKAPALVQRFFVGGDPEGAVRIDPSLVERLLRHDFETHVRELDAALWQAMSKSEGEFIALSPELDEALTEVEADGHVEPGEVTPEEVRAALERHEGSVTRAARELRLKSRFVLYRLMKRYGID